MKWSPDYFCSQLGVPYSDCPTQALREQRANDALMIIAAQNAGVYRSSNYNPVASNAPSAFDPSNALALQASKQNYFAVLATGHVAEVHAAVDDYNKYASLVGTTELIPPSDLSILQISQDSVGILLRSLRQISPEPAIFNLEL